MSTVHEPTLFDAALTAGTHRKADPQTSIDAARSVDPRGDQRRALAALVASGGIGTIDTVCEAITDRDRGCLSRRLTDLEVGGLIRKTDRTELGSRGRPVTVWQVIDR